MAINKAVATLNTDLSNLAKSVAAQHKEEHQFNVDTVKERAALASIKQQEQAIVDQFSGATPPTGAQATAALNKMFALGQKQVQTQDSFTTTLAKDKKIISADASAAATAKAKGKKDLLPAEYHLGLAETNKDRKALGLSSVAHVIRPPAPKPTSTTYTVKPGDTMSGIASHFGISLGALEKANPQVSNPNNIDVGEKLHIPGKGGPTPVPTPGGNTAADQKRAKALAFAVRQANDPNVGYSQDMNKRLGQNQPGTSTRDYDCSGLVYEAYKSIGVTLGADYTQGMWATWQNWAKKIPNDTSQMKPGDLVLVNSDTSPVEHHVLMYMGNGECVAASTSNTSWARQVRTGDSAQSYFNTFGPSRCIVLRPNV